MRTGSLEALLVVCAIAQPASEEPPAVPAVADLVARQPPGG